MTTPFDASDAVVKRWLANWSGTTFLEGESVRPVSGVAHAILTFAGNGGDQASLGPPGARKFLRRESVNIEIKVPASAGTKSGRQTAQAAREVFEGTSFSGLRFFAGEINKLGTDGEWLRFLVTCPFDYHETK